MQSECRGCRLEVKVLLVVGFLPYLRSLDQAILKSDFKILHRVPSAIASARSVLTVQQKELGVAILDIGAGTTNIAVYEEGNLIHLAVLPIGSANITNDIAIGLETDVEMAERIKIERELSLIRNSGRKRMNEGLKDKTIPSLSQKAVSKIIYDRVAEIFDLANKELKKSIATKNCHQESC